METADGLLVLHDPPDHLVDLSRTTIFSWFRSVITVSAVLALDELGVDDELFPVQPVTRIMGLLPL